MGASFAKNKKLPRIALICGGYSKEDEISYKSAEFIEEQLRGRNIDLVRVELRSPNIWVVVQCGQVFDIIKEDFSYTGICGEKICFEAALICAHGTPGEDGKIQAYLELLNIPFVGCDSTTSAVLFNKFFASAIAKSLGVHIPSRWFVTEDISKKNIEGFFFPCIVKPNEGGSSLGVSKVETNEQLRKKLKNISRDGCPALVEEFILGREFSVGVYAKEGGGAHVLPITEIKYDAPFFDYDAKYKRRSIETTPACADKNIIQELAKISLMLYEKFSCKHIVRMDFIYSEKSGAPFFLEINTIPGLSKESIIPQQIEAAGRNFAGVYMEFIVEVIRKKRTR